MQRKNLRSSQRIQGINLPLRTLLDISPEQEANNATTGNIYASIYKAYSDQTGKFPHPSSRGNQYIFVYYDYDSNAILVEALTNCTAGALTKAWNTCFTKVKYNVYASHLHILDNECSEDMKQAFQKNNVDFQLVPPHAHRRNAVERATQTFKSQFIAGLATLPSDFPMKEWDRLLPHAQLTVNRLRASHRQPPLSAHAAALGSYNFGAHPLAPPGTKVLVYETSE